MSSPLSNTGAVGNDLRMIHSSNIGMDRMSEQAGTNQRIGTGLPVQKVSYRRKWPPCPDCGRRRSLKHCSVCNFVFLSALREFLGLPPLPIEHEKRIAPRKDQRTTETA